MYVAENRGYPVGGPNGKPVGDVALLEDTNGDGLPDKRSEFAGEFTFPNGVLCWRGGVIVTCAPDVVYLKDTDGDGKADVREVLLTGFSTDGSTQLRVNAPTLGPDGWVYLAGGLQGGVVYSPKNPGKKVDTKKGDVRFKPDTGEIELVTGKGQYGLTFDDAGNRFVCYNRSQVQHAPLPARYLARNPAVTSPGVLENCPDRVKNLMLGLPNDSGSRIFPISSNLTTADSHAGTYSAACAVHIARGDALPAEYIGKAWSCDPTGNLARYDELVPTGGTFHAKRVRDNVEALRSSDDWCRPVFLADGPDGALYVCDMYRKTIEHPEYLPDEVRKHTDFESGKDMGRVWRLVKTDAKADALAAATKTNVGFFARPDDAVLVTALNSTNGWTRDTAFRLLTEGGVKPTKALAEEVKGGTASPAAVVACLHLLDNAHALDDETALAAMGSTSPIVREVAIRLSEPMLKKTSELAERVMDLASDEDVHVRYAAALAAGEMPDNQAQHVGDVLAELAKRDADDKWFRAAIMTSLPKPDGEWNLLISLTKVQNPSDGVLTMIQDVAKLCASDKRDPHQLETAAADSSHAGFDVRAAMLIGFNEGLRAHAKGDAGAARVAAADDVFAEAARVAADAKAPAARRTRAINLLAFSEQPDGEAALLSLVAPTQPTDLAVAAIRSIAQPQRAAAVAKLLSADRWSRYSPAIRSTILASINGRPQFAPVMLDAIESGVVPAAALSEPQRKWLTELKDETLKGRAAKLLASSTSQDRQKAFEDELAVLKLTPKPANGKRVFANNCASCHRLEQQGVAVGPDLYSIRSQPKESILLHIVIPEKEIAPNFAQYECVTKDGRTLNGIMTADSPESVTLKQVLGIEETIPRERIERLTVSKLSLMPQGLEKVIGKQDMADLLSYLRGEQ
jgi:putative membrane-bound dehydrogenase-like protein